MIDVGHEPPVYGNDKAVFIRHRFAIFVRRQRERDTIFFLADHHFFSTQRIEKNFDKKCKFKTIRKYMFQKLRL